MRTSAQAGDITNLLLAWRNGDQDALTSLMPLVYSELRRIARRQMARERPGQTLQPSALVNEAYLRLVNRGAVDWENRAQFFGLTAGLMRRILVDCARRRNQKRGGAWCRVTFGDIAGAISIDERMLVLDEALQDLAKTDPRKAKVVELRFFAGLTAEEIGEVLNISADTVTRDWKFARAWLSRQMKNSPTAGV